MLTLKRLRTLRHVSILIDHHQGVRRCLVKVTEFKKKLLSLKLLKVNRGDVAACCHTTAQYITTYFYRTFLTIVTLARLKYKFPDDGHRPKYVGAF